MPGPKKTPCPRCKVRYLNPRKEDNVLCRRDNVTYICSDCGRDQEYEDFYAQFGKNHSER